MRPILACWFLCLFAALIPVAAAQTPGSIRGTVTDGEGLPLPGINVYLVGTTFGAASNVDGAYVLDRVPEGTYTLAASAVGYRRETRSLTLRAGERLVVDLVLQEALLQSGEVVVTAARRAQRAADAPVSVSILSERDLEVRNVVSIDQALRYVPGVQMADNQVNVRGSSGFSYNTGSRVLLLVDGMPMLGPDSEGVPFNALPMAQVARIEVVKGPGSALYGGGALGGVINVITKDFPDRPETDLLLFGGAYEPVRYAAWRAGWADAGTPRPFGGGSFTHARRVSDRFGFWANVSYRDDRGHLRLAKEKQLHAYAKLGWRPTLSSRFALLTGLTRRVSDSFLYWNGLDDPLNPGRINLGGSDASGTNDNRSFQFSLLPAFTQVVRPDLFYSLKGRLFGVLIQPLDENLKPRPVGSGTLGLRYGAEAQVNWNPRVGRYLTAGLAGDALATESSFFSGVKDESLTRSQPEAAVFAQWEEALSPTLDLTAGLRFDAYWIDSQERVSKLSPKVNLAWRAIDGLTARAAFGQGFRVPAVIERFVNDQSFLPLIMNLDLKPEESTSYELGLRGFAAAPAGAALQFDAAVFWNDYRRLVEPVFVAAERSFQFVNLTRARIRGIEASVEAATAGERVVARGGYTLLDARDLSEDRSLVFRSSHLVVTSLALRPFRRIDLGLDYRYTSRPSRVDSDFARFVPDADVMVAAHVVDARLGLDLGSVRAALLVKNALDYYYVERPAIMAPPRHLLLQLRATL